MVDFVFLMSRQFHIGINEQGGEIIAEGTQAATLPVHNAYFPFIYNDISGLEIPVEKKMVFGPRGHFCHMVERAFQFRPILL